MVCTSVQSNFTSYADLLAKYQPRSIANEEEYNRVIVIIEDLVDQEDLTEEQETLLELLTELADSYENTYHPIPEAEPKDVLAYLMEANKVKQSDLVGEIGSKGVVSEIINGKRAISKKQAKLLGEKFGVSPSLFI